MVAVVVGVGVAGAVVGAVGAVVDRLLLRFLVLILLQTFSFLLLLFGGPVLFLLLPSAVALGGKECTQCVAVLTCKLAHVWASLRFVLTDRSRWREAAECHVRLSGAG